MAYLAQTEEEKQKEGATSSLLAGFGAAPAPAPTAAPGAAPAPAAPQQASSTFIPYAAYQQANQGGAQKMAGEVAGRVGGEAQKAQQATTAAGSDFSGQVAAGSPFSGAAPAGVTQRLADWQRAGTLSQQSPARAPTMQARAPEATRIGQVTGYTDIGLGYSKEGGGAPVYSGGVSPDQARANATNAYTGPTSIDALESWRNTGARTQAAQDQLAATATDEGRQALLQRQYGTSGGNSRLDAALTGSAGGSAFDALRAKYGDLVGARQKLGASLDQGAADAATSTANAAGQWDARVKGYDADQQAKADRAKASAPPEVQQFLSDKPWPPKTPEEAQSLVAIASAANPALGAAVALFIKGTEWGQNAIIDDFHAHPDNYTADSSATIKTSGTKLPGTRP